jgi:hypothetical protein
VLLYTLFSVIGNSTLITLHQPALAIIIRAFGRRLRLISRRTNCARGHHRCTGRIYSWSESDQKLSVVKVRKQNDLIKQPTPVRRINMKHSAAAAAASYANDAYYCMSAIALISFIWQ